MAITPQPLFQKRVMVNTAVTLYIPTLNVRLESIIFYNKSVSGATLTIYHDIDGEYYDDFSLIYPPVTIGTQARFIYEDKLLLNTEGGLGVKVSVADAIVATGYGWVDV